MASWGGSCEYGVGCGGFGAVLVVPGRFWWPRGGSSGRLMRVRGGLWGLWGGSDGTGSVLGAVGWLLRAVHWGDSVGPFIGAVHGGTGGVLGAAPVRFRFGSGVPTWASWRKPGCSAGRKTPLMATWSPGCARRVFSPSSSTARQRGR